MRRLPVLLLLAILPPGAVAAAAPPPALREVAGIWVAGKALRTILDKRSPHAAVAESVTITPAASGADGRLAWNDGHEASWRRIVRVEAPAADRPVLITGPWEQETPSPKDLVPVPLRVERDAAGKVKALIFLDAHLVQAHGEPWTRIDEPVPAYLNRRLLAGSYRDAQGKAWSFSTGEKAVWPGQSFAYEVSIDESEADCDYIFFSKAGEVGGYKRYGFRWDQRTLRLYEIVYPEDGAAPIHCDRLIAELHPVQPKIQPTI
jgi:hypothetical protein